MKPGDLVRLKSGSHLWTIARVDDEHAEVFVADGASAFKFAMPLATLEPAESPTESEKLQEARRAILHARLGLHSFLDEVVPQLKDPTTREFLKQYLPGLIERFPSL